MTYTAAEMREMAGFWASDADELSAKRSDTPGDQIELRRNTAAMLRQAAEAMDREECANCDGHCDTCVCPEE